MSKKSELAFQIENIANIIAAYEENKNGYCNTVVTNGWYIKSVVEAMNDIKTRQATGTETRADELLIQVIAMAFRSSF